MRKRMLRSFAALLAVIVFTLLPFSSTAQQTGTTRYVYDQNGRIQAVISPTGDATVYEYDLAGNIVSVSHRSMTVTSIVGFNPVLGAVGTSVSVYGTGFSSSPAENIVTFNGTAASVVSATSTEIVANVPVGASDGPITVTSPSGSATSAASFNVLTPVITSFSPIVGDAGTSVTITGKNFENIVGDNIVKFNGVTAEVVSATEVEITTLVPDGGKSGKISVTTPHGTAETNGDFFVAPSGYPTEMVEVTGRLTFGESKRISLPTPDKVAILFFDGVAGQRARLRLSQADIASFDVYIINPAQEVLTRFNSDTSGGFTDALVLPENNTYTILVEPTHGETGSVTLSLYDESASGTIVPGGPSVPLAVVPPAHDAFVTFDAVAGQSISLRLAGVTIPAGNVYFYQPGGKVLLLQALNGADGFVDARTLPLDGRYTIVIEPQPGAGGAATLTLYNVVDVSGSISLDGPPLDVVTSVPGQKARITFYADAGEGPTLNLSNVTFPGDSIVTVYNYNVDEPIVPPATVSAGGAIQLGELTQSATYTILIDPQGPISGSMRVSVNRPPDVTGILIVDGPTVTVPITIIGQNARLTFEGQADQRVTLQASGVTIPASFVSILRPDGTILINSLFMGTSGRSLDNVKLPTAGTYTVIIDPTGGATGSLDLALTTATGIIVPGGPPVSVNLTTPRESTTLSFTGTAGQRVSLELSDINLYAGTIVINKPDGSPLFPSRFIYEVDFIDATVLPDSGTYTIVITAPEDGVGGLTLQLYDASEIIGTITPGGSPLAVTIPTPGQNAKFTFAATAGQRVSLDTSDQTISRLAVSVVAPDGTVLVSRDLSPQGGNDFAQSFGSSQFLDTVFLPVSGVYSVYLDPSYKYTGSITLTLFDVPADVTGSITPDGPSVSVSLAVPGQNARLTFEATMGQRMIVQVDDTSIVSSEVAFYNPDGSRGQSGGIFAGFSPDRLVESGTLSADGVYTILIDPSGSGTGDMTLRLISVPADVTAEVTAGGPPVSLATTAVGQNARITFSGATGQKVSLRIDNLTFAIGNVILFDPSGEMVGFGRQMFAGETWFLESINLTLTGTYTVLLDPYQSYLGGARVTLGDVSDVQGIIEVNGPPATITTTVPGQLGVLSFEGTAGQWLRMTIVSTTVPKLQQFSPPAFVRIQAPDGTTLGVNGLFHNIVDTPPLPVNGTYSIIVDPVSTATGSTTISLVEAPPPDSISIDGAPVTVTTHMGRISHLTFEGTAGQRVSLVGSNFWGTSVSLYGPDLALLGSASAGSFFSSPAFIDVVTLPSTGTYHVAVKSPGSSDGSDQVTVTIYGVTDLTGTIAINGPPVSLTFATPGQKARLTYDGVADRRLALNIANVTVPFGAVKVYNAEGIQIIYNYSFGTEGTFIEFTQFTTGEYTVEIDPDFAGTGNVTVSLLEPAPDVTGVVDVNGAAQTLQLTTPGQKAVATFTGAAGQVVSVRIDVSGTTDCVPIYLWTPTGNYVNSAYICGGGLVEFTGMTLPEDGVYQLDMDPLRGSTGTFVITVTSP